MTASQNLAHEVARALHEGDGCIPEADSAVNDASRATIAEVREKHGEAWLGNVNRREGEGRILLPDGSLSGYTARPITRVLWKWDGGIVYNFGADFVLPRHDAELATLIVEYRARNWQSIADRDWIAARIVAIFDRVEALGGTTLVWS